MMTTMLLGMVVANDEFDGASVDFDVACVGAIWCEVVCQGHAAYRGEGRSGKGSHGEAIASTEWIASPMSDSVCVFWRFGFAYAYSSQALARPTSLK